MLDYGFRAIISPSYADIFYNNCFKNGICPVTLADAEIDELFRRAEQREGYRVTVDLPTQVVSDNDGLRYSFTMDPSRKDVLLKGLDDIGMTLQHEAKIAAFESARKPAATMYETVDVIISKP